MRHMITEETFLDTLFQSTKAIGPDDVDLSDIAPYEQPKPLSLDDRLERLQTLSHRTADVIEKLEEEASEILTLALAEGQTRLAHTLVDELDGCRYLSEMLDKVFEKVQLLSTTRK